MLEISDTSVERQTVATQMVSGQTQNPRHGPMTFPSFLCDYSIIDSRSLRGARGLTTQNMYCSTHNSNWHVGLWQLISEIAVSLNNQCSDLRMKITSGSCWYTYLQRILGRQEIADFLQQRTSLSNVNPQRAVNYNRNNHLPMY